MSIIKLNNGRLIGTNHAPYFVAELNTSHFGDIELAKEMILAAKEAGCDSVKFQSWTADTLYSTSYYNSNPIAKRFVNKYSMSEDDLKKLSYFCDDNDMGFSSTPYSLREAEFLVKETNAPFVKIASMELNNIPFLKKLGSMNSALVLSTGMGDMKEIEKAVYTLSDAGCENLCILHCVSIYPSPSKMINLNNIITMREKFGRFVVGYSDHTIGSEVAAASVALGAGFIEKHFTLDNTKIGMDNQMATEPQEMKTLVEQCNSVYSAMGSNERVLTNDEIEQRSNMRRSLVAARDLSEGDVLTEDDIVLKRPGTGIPADQYHTAIGSVVSSPVKADHLILKQNLK